MVNKTFFEGFNFIFTENASTQDEKLQLSNKIESFGGKVLTRYLKKLNFIIAAEEDKNSECKKFKQALNWEDTKIINIDFIKQCIKSKKLVDSEKYLIDFGTRVTEKRNLDVKEDKKVRKIKKNITISPEIAKKAIDEACHFRHNGVIYQKNGILYDAMLNQTNLGQNNNKFFIIQLIYAHNCYYVWTRWGRVGAIGQIRYENFGINIQGAIDYFCSKFLAKSGHSWLELPYTHIRGKYFVMGREYKEDNEQGESNRSDTNKKIVDSKLDKRVYNLVQQIFDTNMMNNSISHFSYDIKKMPLGKLTKEHIQKSMKVLNDLSIEIAKMNKRNNKCLELSSLFYTIIPHAYGMKTPPIINTIELLKEKIELVESLSEIQIANNLMNQNEDIKDDAINPIDLNYNSLNNCIKPLDKTSKDYLLIQEYINETNRSTYNSYNIEIMDAFVLIRDGETDKFKQFESLHNRKLLWHGSRMSNFVGILSQGLRIAPPEAPVSGYMFGKGVYFADMVSKSANYCCSYLTNQEGLLLLCEVALGDELELFDSDYNALDKLKNRKLNCTKGIGRSFPDPKKDFTLENGTIVPKGTPITINNPKAILNHNEYIVYNTSQIKMKYLIKFKYEY